MPARLGWKQELSRLSPFNRKLVWVYYVFIGFTIVAFGTLTFAFHGEMLRGEKVALGLAAFMGVWWAARIAVDFLVFSQDDWPRGPGFAVGHVVLTATFVALAATYLGLVAWQMWLR